MGSGPISRRLIAIREKWGQVQFPSDRLRLAHGKVEIGPDPIFPHGKVEIPETPNFTVIAPLPIWPLNATSPATTTALRSVSLHRLEHSNRFLHLLSAPLSHRV